MIQKEVRDRAIKDRVEIVQQSYNMKHKFEDQFSKAMKKRKKNQNKEFRSKGNFIKINTK